MIFTKKKITFDNINLHAFKICYNGDLSPIKDDEKAWYLILEKYEDITKGKKQDVVLELRKQIAIKESEIIILDTTLFIIRESFKAYMNSSDKYYIEQISNSADRLKKYGIKFNSNNNIIREHNRCIKLIKNKRNNINQDLTQLKENTGGSMTFDRLIMIVGKYYGGGVINQKSMLLHEFCEIYNMMVDGK